jgi:hypothetical protein
VLDVLRRSEAGLTGVEVAERTALLFGLAPDQVGGPKHPFRNKIEGTLFRQRDRGLVMSMRDGERNVWRIAATA